MLFVVMVRIGSAVICCLLLAAAPARAQNSDIFREDAPPAPGHDPFQMAPADPAPAPKPPPRPHPTPEREPVVVAPPPPPPAPPSAPSFDGVYTGEVARSMGSSGNCSQAPFTPTLIVKGNQLSYQSSDLITGPVNNDGTVTAYSNNRSAMLTGKIQGAEFVGHAIAGTGICHLDLHFQKQR